MEKQSGFTVVELVLVIVLLGVLAAYAVPKFVSLDREARVAMVKNLYGVLQSGLTMAHGKAIIDNCANAASGKIRLDDGQEVSMVFGYPTTHDVDRVIRQIDESIFKIEVSDKVKHYQLRSAFNPRKCVVKYFAATSVDKGARVVMDVSECIRSAGTLVLS